jgi:hypothetical protein
MEEYMVRRRGAKNFVTRKLFKRMSNRTGQPGHVREKGQEGGHGLEGRRQEHFQPGVDVEGVQPGRLDERGVGQTQPGAIDVQRDGCHGQVDHPVQQLLDGRGHEDQVWLEEHGQGEHEHVPDDVHQVDGRGVGVGAKKKKLDTVKLRKLQGMVPDGLVQVRISNFIQSYPNLNGGPSTWINLTFENENENLVGITGKSKSFDQLECPNVSKRLKGNDLCKVGQVKHVNCIHCKLLYTLSVIVNL